MPTYYNPPKTCDMCNKLIGSEFVDGATDRGPWANMCMACFSRYGRGLGMGRGQHYQKQEDGKFHKIAGAVLLMLCIGFNASAETVTKTTDTLGYTHYRGQSITGTTHENSLGYREERWNVNGKNYQCNTRKNSTGATVTRCN